jgi:hypothetical protein
MGGARGRATHRLTAPYDLQERLRQLPREVQADNDHYALCADPQRMAQAIETARQARAEEDTWPQLHYLWPQHPIMDWLGDRVLTHFGRHRAPLLQSHVAATGRTGLHPDEPGAQPQRPAAAGGMAGGQPRASGAAAPSHSPWSRYHSFVTRAGLKAGGCRTVATRR